MRAMPREPRPPQINNLTLNLLHEFALGYEDDINAIYHAPCGASMKVEWRPWLVSGDTGHRISFQPLLAAVEAADLHLRTCTASDQDY